MKLLNPRKAVGRMATATVIGCLALGVAAPAMAQDDAPETDGAEHSIPAIKTFCLGAIDQRLDDLAKVQARVDAITFLRDGHEATIDDIIDDSQSSLTRLSSQIEDSDDRVEIVRMCATVAPDYRVYLVVLPQTHLTVAADRSQAAVVGGEAVIEKLNEAIAIAAAAGADVADAEMYRDEAVAHLASADAANDGVAATVLSVTPDSYNNGAGAAVLENGRSHMRTTHQELKSATEDGVAAAKALRDAVEALK